MSLPAKLSNDRAAIDRARRGAVAYPLSHVLARPNERGDAHLECLAAPAPGWLPLTVGLAVALVILGLVVIAQF